MIVAYEESRLRLITQPDHARFAAELMGLWRTEELREHQRRDELLFAIREHDNGWNEADAAPRADPATGAPVPFTALPTGPRIELWERAVERFAGSHPYAALLILHHSLAIHEDRSGEPWDEFRRTMAERAERLAEAAGVSQSMVDGDYRWLDLADLLSLRVCCATTGSFERAGVTGRFAPSGEAPAQLRLSPFPLAGSTTFRIPCRYLPRRAYTGDADLGAELAASRWQTVGLRVVDGGELTPGA